MSPVISLTEITEGPYSGRIGVTAPATFYNRLKEMPGATYSRGDQVWTMSKTFQTTCVLAGVAKETGSKLTATPELAVWRVGQLKEWNGLTELSQKLTSEETFDGLYPHQVQDMAWLTYDGGPRGRLLLNEMGIGKTRPTIHSIVQKQLFPALVICPKTVARLGWVKQFADTYPEVRVGVATGTPAQRVKTFKAMEAGELDVIVTSWDALKIHTRFEGFGSVALKRCVECGGPQFSQMDLEMAEAEGLPKPKVVTSAQCQAHKKELNATPWKAIVGDEVHRALNSTTATRMALGGLLKYSPAGCYRWFLTGTPMRSRPEGLWSLLNGVDPEGWPNKSKWVDRYCEKGWGDDGWPKLVGYNPETKAELDRTLRAITRRVLKAEVLDLPDKIRGGGLVHEVTLGTEQRRVYNEMRDFLVAQVKEGEISAKSAMNKANRLTFLANATGYPDEDFKTNGKLWLRAPSAKIDELVTLIKEEELVPPFAFATTSRVFLELIVKTLVDKKVYAEEEIGLITGAIKDDERFEAANDFQAGRIPVIGYTHAAGGVGIDLYKADTLVLMERSWDNISMSQSIDRVHRIGMPNRAVQIMDFVAVDTVEQRQMDRLSDIDVLVNEVTHDREKLLALLMGK